MPRLTRPRNGHWRVEPAVAIGGPEGDAAVAVGLVLSMRRLLVLTVDVPAMFVAEHDCAVPAGVVSVCTTCANGHVDETGADPFQLTFHTIVTSLTYQPLSPAVPCRL